MIRARMFLLALSVVLLMGLPGCTRDGTSGVMESDAAIDAAMMATSDGRSARDAAERTDGEIRVDSGADRDAQPGIDAATDALTAIDAMAVADGGPDAGAVFDAWVDAEHPLDAAVGGDRGVSADAALVLDAALDAALPEPEPVVCEMVLGDVPRPGAEVTGQLLEVPETRQVGVDDEGRAVFLHGQAAPDGRLVLDVNSSFFSYGSALVLTGDGPANRPGSSFNNDRLYQVGENWRAADSGLMWGVEFTRAGRAEVLVQMGVDEASAGAEVEVALGEQRALCRTEPTGGQGTPGALWRVVFEVEPGVQNLVLTARSIPQGVRSLGTFYRVDLTGGAVDEARVIRARWRPAAVHAQWRSSTMQAPSRLWVMELEPRLAGQGFYAPVTTPFGYYGSPRNDQGHITGVNFSMWSFGRGQEAPPLHQFSHIIAIGHPDGQFGGFDHEGTGAKVRGWNPYAPEAYRTQTLALRLVPGDPYDTYYGYYLDPEGGDWRLFAAGRRFNDGRPNENLTAGAFVEVAGPPQRQRTGQWERKMSYRGWYRDLNGDWHTIDTQQINGSEDFINKRWGMTGDQHWMTMGGLYHWQDEPGRRNNVLPDPPPPADRPDYLKGAALAGLEALPARLNIQPAVDIEQNRATARFTIEDPGTEPRIRLFYGTEDALTFADRWQNAIELDDAQVGNNEVALAGLMPGTAYYYRVLLQNEEGQIWTLETQGFETQPQ